MKRYAELNENYTRAQTASIRAYAYLQPAITVASGVSMALLIWYGGKAAADGSIKVGILVADFAYAVALFRPLREIADKWNVFLAGLAAAEKLFAVLEWPVELPEDAAAEPYDLRGDIAFEDVWFAYEGDRWAISNLSFHVSAGARVGIVGATGCGKSTLIALLLRFYEPQRGRILLDGKDLREYERRRLRASFGLVQQDVFLFSGSVAENIAMFQRGNAGGTSPLAALEDLGLEVPADRQLSERGGNVSAGERQLVSFARAAAAQPVIWILDEATSNMDTSSEQVMERVLARTAQGKTLLRVAHRLASTRDCDPILVMNKGHLAEIGGHAGLLARGGLYARLFKYQEIAEGGEP
jgi:ATP-binding cassette subfamily B protein